MPESWLHAIVTGSGPSSKPFPAVNAWNDSVTDVESGFPGVRRRLGVSPGVSHVFDFGFAFSGVSHIFDLGFAFSGVEGSATLVTLALGFCE